MALFEGVPARAIKISFDADTSPWFKVTHEGKNFDFWKHIHTWMKTLKIKQVCTWDGFGTTWILEDMFPQDLNDKMKECNININRCSICAV